MLILSILIIPLIGIFTIATDILGNNKQLTKYIGLLTTIINLVISLVIFMLFDFSNNQFQFVQEYYELNGYNIFFGTDGLSIYFVLLTTIIMPIAILSNWVSINDNVKWYVIIVLLLETLLLAVFLVLDVLLFYISFESILPPLFLLIGIFGSSNKVRASFYLFLYTLLGSLFLLLSILTMYSIMGTTDYYALFKMNFNFLTQLFLFYGVFIAFAVKTPTIFLNTWLLKAHVESPLGGSVILAAIVLKLSLYGILRLILPILPKASLDYTYVVYLIGVITIIYASFSTLRTIDVKELIAYSSVSHAAVYLIGVFSNTLQGIGGGILLGLAHGFVSSGLFICTGGVLYDRSSTRLITYYRGITQIMPLFSIVFFILCLSNAGTPLSLNFVGEFLSLYGTFERLPILGALASTSIILSAAYTIYMFNRISFGGKLSNYFKVSMPDLNKREFIILLTLIIFTVVLGIYPAVIIDGFNFSVSTLIYSFSNIELLNEGYNGLAVKVNDFCFHPETILEFRDNLMFYLFSLFVIMIWLTICLWYYSNKSARNSANYLDVNNNYDKKSSIKALGTLLLTLCTTGVIFVPFGIVEEAISGGFMLSEPLESSSAEDFPTNENDNDVAENAYEKETKLPTGGSDSNDDDDNKVESASNKDNTENSNNPDIGNSSTNDNEENPTINKEGIEEMIEHENNMRQCEHRTIDRQFIEWGPDMGENVHCDYCHNVVTNKANMCGNCNTIICEDCDDAEAQKRTYPDDGSVSSNDSGFADENNVW